MPHGPLMVKHMPRMLINLMRMMIHIIQELRGLIPIKPGITLGEVPLRPDLLLLQRVRATMALQHILKRSLKRDPRG